MAKKKGQQSIRNVSDPPAARKGQSRPVVIPYVPGLNNPPAPPPPPVSINPLGLGQINTAGLPPHLAVRMRALLLEKALRRIDALRLYQPLPIQSDFHHSRSRINIVRGSNRSGKTLCAAVEVARAVTGQDPYGKYPLQGGRCFAVGKDWGHIGETMWRKLSGTGVGKAPFQIIRDEKTGDWRAYRPWDGMDQRRKEESVPAPGLITPRFIQDIAWEDKKLGRPKKVYLSTGWELCFFSSEGKPPQGQDVDLWWFDEEIIDPDWFPEMTVRTADRRGRGIWSATPQAGTEVLFDLHERAEKEMLLPNPSVREHILLVADNPHIDEEAKKAMVADLSEEEAKVRVGGEFAFVSFRVYPEFNTILHGIDLDIIPPEWTRYMVVDPGHQVCAVLFAAIPPPGHELAEHVILYDELYLKDCDATKFAVNVMSRSDGQNIHASIIDPHGSVLTDIGSGKSVLQQYSDALREQGFFAASTGTSFIPGCDDRQAGRLKVHGWLRVNSESGKPKFKVVRGRCPNLQEEFKRYVKKRINNQVVDEPNDRRWNHLMDCVRYLAMFDPRWVKPRPAKERPSPAILALRAKQKRRQEQEGGSYIRLGAGGTHA